MDPAKSPRLSGTLIALLLLGVGALVGHSVRGWWLERRAGEAARAESAAAPDPLDHGDAPRDGASQRGRRGGEGGFEGTALDMTALLGLDRDPSLDGLPSAPPGLADATPPAAVAGQGAADTLATARGARDAAVAPVARAATPPQTDADPVAAAVDSLGPVLAVVGRSVVGITTIHRRGGLSGAADDGFGEVDGLPPAVDASSLGTGVLFDPAGLILTALHVVADPEQILVQIPEVGTREALLVGADPSTDLAVLRLEPRLSPGVTDRAPRERFATASLASEYEVARGDVVFALASAHHFDEPLSAGLVQDVVVHIRHVAVPPVHITNEYLHFDAASAPGTSGSPVFDGRGQVVGVLTRSGRAGRSSYALTSRTVRRVLDAMERGGGRVDRGHLGVNVRPADADAFASRLPEGGIGVQVDVAHAGYPAERAGLMPGDVIVRYDGRAIPDLSTFHEWVTWSAPGSRVELEVWREGVPLAPVAVRLGTVGDPPGETG